MKNSTAGNKSRCMGGSAGKGSGNKRKQKEDSDGISSQNGEAAAKIKIYLPKAIKVCPSSVTKYIQSMIGSSPRNVEDGDRTVSGLKAANNGGQGWGANNEELDGLVCDLDSSSPNSLQNDIMLDDIFEEYQQLLKGRWYYGFLCGFSFGLMFFSNKRVCTAAHSYLPSFATPLFLSWRVFLNQCCQGQLSI
ncbi:MYB-RELATED PROTEIN 308-LIKE [Salix viminalis]|uniref:MYB-RELATED PROTEIN 308-LIKE n=1 Tax=Salix viminalis TaxID=40686 RepID=A0A9Q0TME4_SALVM|nr:MYB-RELATED PROTEIN 308-LIKE [Salix viminalis]